MGPAYAVEARPSVQGLGPLSKKGDAMKQRRILYPLISIVIIISVLIISQIRPDIPLDTLREIYANSESLFIDIEGLPVHTRDQGKGPTLVLVHGTSSSLHTWDGWIPELKDSFRIIRMDLPGFGLTGPNRDHDYRISSYVSFIDAFLNKLGITNCYLAGNSLGGEIAWAYALKNPQKVSKLILIDAAGYPLEKLPPVFRLGRIPLLRNLLKVVTPRFFVEGSLKEVYGDDSKVTPELVDRYYQLALRPGNRDALLARIAVHDEEDCHLQIKDISVPTLILWGKEDKWIPLEYAHRFDADIPRSKLIIYEGVGHVPMEEIPQKTASDVKFFLTRDYLQES
jgi:pimeloyl-ACP methyl ester carboxylesterase